MTTIRQVVITEFGGPDVVKVVDSTCVHPPLEHIQIAPIYSGFNGGDIGMRKGVYPDQVPAPLTPGYCLVGTVVALGERTASFQPGDIVGVLTKYDAEAELVNQPEKYCVKIPNGLDLQQVTALVLDWNTAYGMVKHTAKVTADQRVFIHGLSGAVGCGLMMLCRLQGAEVYGTASARNHAQLQEYGAKPFVYTDKVWMEKMKELGGAHAVFDPLGFESFDESYNILTPDGILVAYGNNKDSLDDSTTRDPGEAIVRMMGRNNPNGRRTTFYGIFRDGPTYIEDLKALINLLKEGAVQVPIKNVWGLEDIQVAHRQWGSQHGIGSLLIRIGKD